ncbi:hypothetical protein BDZ97DRAFT_1918266 [Flammula alnicola]|nr:hypothetical protein BDZ97DRAFT_1918266 [Flammula alnicola]
MEQPKFPQSHSQLHQQPKWIPSSPSPSSSIPPPTRRLAEAVETPTASFLTPSPSPPTRKPVAAVETPTASSLESNSRRGFARQTFITNIATAASPSKH